ncbi:GNAT family N-acetyltransferase [Chelativorans sp. SCAU2101]|uniref:GNAT family N-acetyltransferase n=1 Tax=Chelativorans petroleitrophicus TaxID=2975484 RepID=A0A9X2X8X0_9HYPH|nr:GNAT family N-acetyltransferase [Chelativorans petroleitrophicus]MCT8990239.1 GNAT family N-acetyltransferase [Chelativorans petroleitrophicus]
MASNNKPAPPFRLLIDPFPSNAALNELWRAAWDDAEERDFSPVLQRSLAHIGAYCGERIIGFVNIAWDGGRHAFLLDPCVHPDFRRQGIGTVLVREAARCASERGAHWLHVDFEPHLERFYAGCGFLATKAGLIRLGGGKAPAA